MSNKFLSAIPTGVLDLSFIFLGFIITSSTAILSFVTSRRYMFKFRVANLAKSFEFNSLVQSFALKRAIYGCLISVSSYRKNFRAVFACFFNGELRFALKRTIINFISSIFWSVKSYTACWTNFINSSSRFNHATL
jgi:hypothetical protein